MEKKRFNVKIAFGKFSVYHSVCDAKESNISLIMCKKKENAELIADILNNVLNADAEGSVYGMVDGCSSLLAHLLNTPQQMVKDDAERRKIREQEYNEQRIDNIEKRIECLENAFKDCQKRNGMIVPLFACACNPVERFYKK